MTSRFAAKQQAIENDITSSEAKINELASHGGHLSKEGHFDGKNIESAADAVREKLESLKQPAVDRRGYLKESVQLHQCKFDLDGEEKWIQERIPAQNAKAEQSNSLIDAQNAMKKHEKLSREVQAHQPLLEKFLHCSKEIESNQGAGDNVRTKAALTSDDTTDSPSSRKATWPELLKVSSSLARDI